MRATRKLIPDTVYRVRLRLTDWLQVSVNNDEVIIGNKHNHNFILIMTNISTWKTKIYFFNRLHVDVITWKVGIRNMQEKLDSYIIDAVEAKISLDWRVGKIAKELLKSGSVTYEILDALSDMAQPSSITYVIPDDLSDGGMVYPFNIWRVLVEQHF